MRLRRETGDFSIVRDAETGYSTLPAGLSAEDLVGVIIEYDAGSFCACISAENDPYDEGVINLTFSHGASISTVTYTVETGAVTA